MIDILETLNDKQKEAVEATEGPVLILAGAGSGKTRVLTHRAAYLISEKKVAPWNIMAITFTNKAAEEMRERIDRLCEEDGGKVWVATFHASCGRILRQHAGLLGYTSNYTIYDTDDTKTLMKRVLKKLDIDTKDYNEKAMLGHISSAKNRLEDPDFMYKCAGNYRERRIAEIYEEYQRQLKQNDAMDFDDMLVNTVLLFKQFPEVLKTWQARFQYIMVDEYQDTNTVQFEFIRLLAGGSGNICVVGDDDQSIYKFRGADIRNILDFEKTFPGTKVIKLEQNYRSTSNILNAANDVIANNTSRKEKRLWTDHEEGDVVDLREYETGFEEAEEIITDIKANLTRFAYGDTAVLYRTNAQSRLLEEKCVLYNVPYKLVGGVNFYQRREIKDIVAYLKVVAGGLDDLSVQRVINVPKRGIGQTTLSKIVTYADRENIGLYDALYKGNEVGLNVGTREKIKGFTDFIESVRAKMGELSVKELVEYVAENSGYIKALHDEGTVEAETRIENIAELINKASEFPDEKGDSEALSHFLEEVALIADVDTLDSDENRVVLMTLHGAKGLEFPRVYIAGMEEGLFPSYMSISSGSEEDIEEERRLCYVGITRAKEKLTLTAARQRLVMGEMRNSMTSRFVDEISDEFLDREKKKTHKNKTFTTGNITNASSVRKPVTKKGSSIDTKSISAYLGKNYGTEKLSELDYRVGDRVKHIKFGEGSVKKIEQGKRDFEVTIDFDSVGEKKLFASFAKLTKI